ncbi:MULTISPECIES: hypothetical protein [unclassified Coleofasciculus]|nr:MULTISPECIES: hypothetical protein [unclassified Coleofasciculus]MBE9129689.1 hypothetical protein [Coleofasciculus sp. LEGE 07081]MBE9152209.1 hypothetical protein [Coleofasciculus sp. LEGE 07092]
MPEPKPNPLVLHALLLITTHRRQILADSWVMALDVLDIATDLDHL